MLTARMASARSETSVFKFKERREALRQAHVMAQQDYQMAVTAAVEDMYQYQGQLDTWWRSLCAGDQDTVLGALAAAFEDNAARAAAVGVDGRAASLVVVVPPVSDVPDRRPSKTASGNLSLKKLTKTETNEVYKSLVAGHVLLTVREALATVPTLSYVRIVAVRPGGQQAGPVQLVPLLAAAFDRAAVEAVDWNHADAVEALTSRSRDLLLAEKGVTRELQALDLSEEPQLAASLRALAVEISHGPDVSDPEGRAL